MNLKKPLDIPGLSAFAEAFSKGMGTPGKPGERPNWWQTYSFPEPPYAHTDQFISYAKIALFFQSLTFDGKAYDYEHQGDFIGTIDAVITTLEQNGGKLVYHSLDRVSVKRTGLFFLIENGALFVEIKNLKQPKLQYVCVVSSKELLDKTKKLMNSFLNATTKKNPLYMISSNSHDTDFIELGSFPVALNVENYSTDVLQNYQYVVKQFNKETPSGRLLILNGLPGTGKTYIVRGLLNDLDSGTFLLIPPDMVEELAKPRLIETISEASQNKFSKGPLYLIIEDADIALLKRGGDNMGIISALLNLADGLLGSAFDLRIVASTNANKLEMEPAILRPGRLCKLINLDKLPPQQANALLKKLNPNSKREYNTSVVLADIYLAASEDQ